MISYRLCLIICHTHYYIFIALKGISFGNFRFFWYTGALIENNAWWEVCCKSWNILMFLLYCNTKCWKFGNGKFFNIILEQDGTPWSYQEASVCRCISCSFFFFFVCVCVCKILNVLSFCEFLLYSIWVILFPTGCLFYLYNQVYFRKLISVLFDDKLNILRHQIQGLLLSSNVTIFLDRFFKMQDSVTS